MPQGQYSVADLAPETPAQRPSTGQYSAADLAPDQPEQPGFFRGLWDTVNPLPAIKHYSQLAEQEQEQIRDALQKGDYKTAAKAFAQSLPGVDLATDIGKAQADQFHQAYQDFTNTKEMPDLSGRMLSASGHVAAGSIPVVGPAAAEAGQNIGTPGKTAYGLGQTAGLLLPFGLSAASRLAGPVANVIRAAPETPVNELLAQRSLKGQRLLAKQGAAVEQAGLTGPAAEVKAKTAATLARVGPQIPAEAQRLSALGTLPDAQRIYNELDDLRKADTSSNGVPLNDAYDAHLKNAQDKLLEIASNPKGPGQFSDYDNLLNAWQEQAKPAYGSAEAASGAKAYQAASARLRGVLRDTQGTDTLNALHDEFAVNKAANQLATLARPKAAQLGPLSKVAVRVGSTAAGSVVGNLLGHPYLGGEAGFLVAPQLEKAILNGSLRRAPAAVRNSIADSIARGDLANANRLATAAAQLPGGAAGSP